MAELPTRRELEALKVLWRRGEATVREIHQEMGAGGEELAYTTVLSLVQTMAKKGLITRDSTGRGKTHTYVAQAQPDKTMRNLAGNFLDKVFDGAVGQYLVSALESRRPTAKELDELERMIARAKESMRDIETGESSGGSQ